jgi:hypothetical protein
MVGLDGLWARRPHLADWLARVRARPSFPRAITEWLSAADRERFDIPREETRRKVQDILGTA